jgi:hypothetical protein
VALLEPVIHEVLRPRPGHLFHPKVWIAEFFDYASEEHTTRVLVLSRNLTADRSWDVLLRLDGVPSRRVNPDNDGLVRLVRALPTLTKSGLGDDRDERVMGLADRLRRVEWEMPDGVTELRFWPFGLRDRRKPNLDELFTGSRRLVVSPFVTPVGIESVVRPGRNGSEAHLVSRAEELDRISPDDLANLNLHVMSPLAGLDDASDESRLGAPFGALHAKVIVVERGRSARMFVGSANATEAAFGGNVELLCELNGPARVLGIDTLIGAEAPFRSLLDPYVPPDEKRDDEVDRAGRDLDAYLVDLAQLSYEMHAVASAGGWARRLTTTEPIPAPSATTDLRVAPLNRPFEAVSFAAGHEVAAEWPSCDGVELTPFALITARRTVAGEVIQRSTVVRAELVGGPADRFAEIMARQIDTPEKFLRLLFLILGLGPGATLASLAKTSVGIGSWGGGDGAGIFEALVQALAVDPSSIDRLEEIVTRLATREESIRVLPAGWDEVWATVRAARKALPAER